MMRLGSESYVVVAMYEVCLVSADDLCKRHRLVDSLMGMVGLVKAQRVYDKGLHAVKILQLLRVYGLHVGDIGEMATYAIAEYRQIAVHHADGHYVYVADGELLVRNDTCKRQLRHTGIELQFQPRQHGLKPLRWSVREAVRQIGAYMAQRCLVAIEPYGTELAIRAQVVDTSDMVVVFVGKQHAVDGSEVQWQ